MRRAKKKAPSAKDATTPVPAPPLRARLAARMQTFLLRGLIVVVPLGITVYVLLFIYRFTAARLVPLVRPVLGDLPDYMVVLFSMVLFFGTLFILGVVAKAAVGRKFIALLEYILHKIPLVKTVYGASKQVVDVMAPGEAQGNYQAAVLVHFPCPGVKSLGFITGWSRLGESGDLCRVFVPTTPNPTSGYFIMYPPQYVESTGISVEDAVKSSLSAGILLPEAMDLSPVNRAEQEHAAPAEDEDPDDGHPAGKVWRARRHLRRFVRRTRVLIQNRLLSGLLVIVPLAITVAVVRFIFGLTVGKITPLTQMFFGELPPYAVTAISLVFFIAGVYAIGVVATVFLGKRLIMLGEFFIDRIPLVKTVYSSSKQMVESLTLQSASGSMKVPVVVKFPFTGAYAMGFLVGTVRTGGGALLYKAYLPTTPNITVGILQLYQPEDIYWCGLGVEESVKSIVSGGILAPDSISLTPFSEPGTRALAGLED
ncbi:MAG: DUF502 domain-containing protein [Candidatus Hydrogenedentes bacterium]|nr:DUF502 domain-containing protein [Candidatus Hydrogenedentota bacterium]